MRQLTFKWLNKQTTTIIYSLPNTSEKDSIDFNQRREVICETTTKYHTILDHAFHASQKGCTCQSFKIALECVLDGRWVCWNPEILLHTFQIEQHIFEYWVLHYTTSRYQINLHMIKPTVQSSGRRILSPTLFNRPPLKRDKIYLCLSKNKHKTYHPSLIEPKGSTTTWLSFLIFLFFKLD